jgi:hypothetical protein
MVELEERFSLDGGNRAGFKLKHDASNHLRIF